MISAQIGRHFTLYLLIQTNHSLTCTIIILQVTMNAHFLIDDVDDHMAGQALSLKTTMKPFGNYRSSMVMSKAEAYHKM